MPVAIPRFLRASASPADMRHEAEALDDAAAALMWARDRGHLDSEQSVMALKLYSGLRERADEFKHLAFLKERPAVNEMPT